ncbi:MAG: hypothetical protein K0Q50_2355 [Vampirovibrio sp.]|jgi:prepilin-type N-terminal cleavage/methylation domain-containing protein|nr:hypothetical protein [Vampirovibrio sp.]
MRVLPQNFHSLHRGFSLAELLISLAVLGVITVFAIPKVLSAQQDQRCRAVAKEAYAALSQIQSQGLVEGVLSAATVGDYVMSRLNTVKVCPNDAAEEGCWDSATQGIAMEMNEPGVILHSGAYVLGLNNCCGTADGLPAGELQNGVFIDANGPAGPNLVGHDQFSMA